MIQNTLNLCFCLHDVILFTTEWCDFDSFVCIVLFTTASVFRDSMPHLLVPEFSVIEGIFEKISKTIRRGNPFVEKVKALQLAEHRTQTDAIYFQPVKSSPAS